MKGKNVHCLVCGTLVWSQPNRPRTTCSYQCRDDLRRAERYDDARRMKKCTRCEEWQPYDLFAKPTGPKSGKDSLSAYCRRCSTEISRSWSDKNSERRKELNQKAHDNREPRRWDDLTDAEKERRNAGRRKWGKKNRHKTRVWNKMRVHRERAGGPMPHPLAVEEQVCIQDGKCPYCGGLLLEYHIDHKTPISRGGTNDPENLHLVCPPCNLKKGTRTHDEYLTVLNDTVRRLV